MPFDGIALYGVIYELKEYLLGGRISRVNQPSKSELIFFIRRNRQEYKLLLSADSLNCRIHLTDKTIKNPSKPPMFCMLLRKHLIRGRIVSITQKGLDRIVEIVIHNTDEYMQPVEYKLIAEIMGRHSNIVLLSLKNNTIIDSIKRISSEVNRFREVLPGKTYVYPPSKQKIDLISVKDGFIEAAIKETVTTQSQKTLSRWILDNFAGFSGIAAQETALRTKIDHEMPIASLDSFEVRKLAKVLVELKKNLILNNFNPKVYLSSDSKEPADFWVFEMYYYKKQQALPNFTINNAVDFFYTRKDMILAINTIKNRVRTEVKKQINKLNQNLIHLKKRAVKVSDIEKYRLWGEILSANIYRVRLGQSFTRLPNYYNFGKKITIPLNRELSAAHNAQIYFKKYKQLKSSKKNMETRLKNILMEIDYLESSLVNIEHSNTIGDLLEIQQELQAQNYIKIHKKENRRSQKSKPLQFKSSDGTFIKVGKNNRQNDELTFKKSKPDDIWLHARDVPGSHVIIEGQGKTVSNITVAEAASLAAYFSKDRNSSNVPVDYTFVRHVKKPKGARPGFVIYYHQKTIYVTPEKSILKKLAF